MALKVGIVGIGFMGKMHFDTYKANPKAEVAAIADSDEKKLAGDWSSIGGNIGDVEGSKVDLSGIKTYKTTEELVADPDLDVVDITLPTYMHPDACVKAFEAGKNVLCEKPIALDWDEATRMIKAAKKSRKVFMIAHCIRFWPEYAWAKKTIDENKYGKLVAATFQRISPTPTWSWTNWLMDDDRSGSALLDLHIHDADFIQYLVGRPKAVFSRGATGKVSKGVDHIVTQYIFDDPGLVVAEGGWAVEDGHGFVMAFTLLCENATITYDCRKSPPLAVHTGRGEAAKTEHPELDGKYADGYQAEIDYFLDCVQQGKQPEVVTPKDARTAVAICQAERKSVKTGKIVRIRKG